MTRFLNRIAGGIAAAGCMLASLSAPAHAQQGVTDQEIKLGWFGALSGPASFAGGSARDGINLALKEINEAGGINGRKLTLVFEDDANSPAKALAAVKKLVEQDQVFAVFSSGTSNSTTATLDFMLEKGIVLYVSSASAPRVTFPFQKTLFRGQATEVARYGELDSELIADYVKAKKVGIISARDEYSKNSADAVQKLLKEQYSIDVVRTEFNIGDKDFTPQLLELQAASPDVIAVYGYPADGTLVLKQIRELGLEQKIFAGSALVDDATLKNAGKAAEGIFGYTILPFIPSSSDPAMVEWVAKMKKEYPSLPAGRPNQFDVLGYSDIYVVAEALKQAGKDLTTDKLVSSLEGLKEYRAAPIAQPITFSTKHHIGNMVMQPQIATGGMWQKLDWAPKRPSAVLKKYE